MWERYNDTGTEAREQGLYVAAEQQWLAALKEAESFGQQDPRLTATRKKLADLYYAQGEYSEAEPLYQRSLEIMEKARGVEHSDIVTGLDDLASLYAAHGNYAEAEPLYRRSLGIVEKACGAEHPSVATSIENYAALLREM